MSSLSRFFAAQDMTEGTPWKKIVSFAIPLLIGNIAQQLYNTADSVIVGKYVGDLALAAVGGCGPTLNLLIVLFVGIATGAGIMVAQYFGAKQKEELSYSVGTCLTLTGIASLIMMVLGTLAAPPLLRLLDTPVETYDMCVAYMRIYFLGIAGMGFYNIPSGILRGLGDSLSALNYLIVAAGLNIALDLLFVAKFGMGVPGVAIATIIAQFISASLCLCHAGCDAPEKRAFRSEQALCQAAGEAGPALRIVSGSHVLLRFGGPVPHKLLRRRLCGLQHHCDAHRRLCDDAQLFLRQRHDHLHRPERGRRRH